MRSLSLFLLAGCVDAAAPRGSSQPHDPAAPRERPAADPARSSIVDGDNADLALYPATGVLTAASRLRCTGTLIAPDVVLTAAHCLSPPAFGYLGFTLDPDLNDGAQDIVKVLVAHQHPDYDATNQLLDLAERNDVGVVILERPIEGVALERVDVAAAPDSVPDLGLCGYGRLLWPAPSLGLKQTARVRVERTADFEFATHADDPQPCGGDSGAPLFAETASGRALVGLISRAVGPSIMCDTGAIATRTAPYAAWIAEASQDRDVGCGGGIAAPFAAIPWLWRRRRRPRR